MEIKTGILYLLGCGPGAPDLVTSRVREIALQSDTLIGCPRTHALFPQARAQRIIHEHNLSKILELLPSLLASGKTTAWLCTGDTSLFSVAHTARNAIGSSLCAFEPGISSVQIACARLAVTLPEVHIASAHGRDWKLQLPLASSHLCILSGSLQNLQNLLTCAFYLEATHQLFVLADLSLSTEIIHNINPLEIAEWVSHPRALFFWRKYD